MHTVGPGHRRPPSVALLGAVLALGLAGCRGQDHGGRVLVLGLDGLDPRAVDLLMSEGSMPNFARLRQEGAYGRLEAAKPLLSPVLWTTIATGRTPDQHGIGHFTATDPATGETLPVTSQMRHVKAVWDIASEHERKVGVVGWWATWPAEPVNGFVVSDHTCYHFLFPEGAEGDPQREGLTYPPGLFQRIAPWIRRPGDVTPEQAARFIDVPASDLERPFEFEDDLSHFKWAIATADSYRKIGLELWRAERPDLMMTYTEGTDSLAHLFGHLFRAQGLTGELAEQQKRYGRAVEQMYHYADDLVGEYVQAMDERTTLVVLSDHGFDLGATQDDPSKTRDMRRVSEKFHDTEGVLYVFGRGVKARARLQGPKQVDVTPTLLALLGLPRAADMPGRVLAEGLDFDPPGPPVPTYETGAREASGAQDSAADAQILERLRSLGYLGKTEGAAAGPAVPRSPTGERNIAGIHFEAGRYGQALTLYEKLLADQPDDASLHASIAGVLGALGRYDEALAHLDKAVALEPLNVEAYHNRGVILERQGKVPQAVEQYRTAVRYNPSYEPSVQALVRLTGSAEVRAPRNEAEARAQALAQQAADEARHGDYADALRLLEQAESLAPKYALVYQYRSNVSYLAGDLPGAIAALQKGLALEPDNALFQANLDRLRQQLAEGK